MQDTAAVSPPQPSDGGRTYLRYREPPGPISLDRPSTITLIDNVADWVSAQIPK